MVKPYSLDRPHRAVKTAPTHCAYRFIRVVGGSHPPTCGRNQPDTLPVHRVGAILIALKPPLHINL